MNPERSAKDLHVVPIASRDADAFVQRVHYSGKTVQNSILHLGVFLDRRLHGAMQFGPSLDKRKVQSLVRDTPWHGFLELNRMAFDDALPRNSESRALGVALRLLRKSYPQVEWVLSFADATQCGDGTIYRAAGFLLTGITQNSTLYEFPDGERVSNIGIKTGYEFQRRKFGRTFFGEAGLQEARRMGAVKMPGFQLRYIAFVNPAARARLTVPVLPFSEIARRGATMYRGQTRVKVAGAAVPPSSGRSNSDPPAPTSTGDTP